jgi:hypothetical protein
MKQSIPRDDKHLRPDGVDDITIEGLGKLSEGLEIIERARGSLYDFHQLMGRGDIMIGEVADILAKAGHKEEADSLRKNIIGLNILAGRWTFQIVEEFDDGYYAAVKQAEESVRNDLVQGRRHIYESEMKEANRTKGLPDHEARP